MRLPGIGFTIASWMAYKTQNAVRPRNSPGSNHTGDRVTYSAQRISPSGFVGAAGRVWAPASPNGASASRAHRTEAADHLESLRVGVIVVSIPSGRLGQVRSVGRTIASPGGRVNDESAGSARAANLDQRHARQRHRNTQRQRAVAHRGGRVRLESLEALTRFDGGELIWRRILRSAERTPYRVAVAVRRVDAPVAHAHVAGERQPLEPHGDRGLARIGRILIIGVSP